MNRASSDADEITGLLDRWGSGDASALRELMPVVYAELRRLAGHAMRGERGDHTLQTTALVHEAYMRLAGGRPPMVGDRRHFYALAARLMRRILVDHARGLNAARRGGGALKVPLEQVDAPALAPGTDLLAVDQAIDALAKVDARKAKVVELRFFGGLDVKETARILEVSVPTVVADTRMARAWIYDRIEGCSEE